MQAALSCLWTQSCFDLKKKPHTRQQPTKQNNKNFLSLLPCSFPFAGVGVMQGPPYMQSGQQK